MKMEDKLNNIKSAKIFRILSPFRTNEENCNRNEDSEAVLDRSFFIKAFSDFFAERG